eukprot:scaffold85381_cov30-Tisochrysis_lutea.AAC.1
MVTVTARARATHLHFRRNMSPIGAWVHPAASQTNNTCRLCMGTTNRRRVESQKCIKCRGIQ